ncbi:MAG: 30S ribosomal protein S5 [Patescibacteria group bacterium]|nr:30S ribosomal protein S5 [Patescibacteria group bacterium]
MSKQERPKRNNRRFKKEKPEFAQKVIDIARVTRVVKGGKRFSFRTAVVIGDKKGKVGVGVAKGPDMRVATEKAYADAKKNMIVISFKGSTIPYSVYQKLGSAKVLLKPATKGHGIVAGGAVRVVMSFAGISDVSSKMLGAKNKLNNARATILALEQFKVKKTRERILEEKEAEKVRKAEENKVEEKAEEKKVKKTKDKEQN